MYNVGLQPSFNLIALELMSLAVATVDGGSIVVDENCSDVVARLPIKPAAFISSGPPFTTVVAPNSPEQLFLNQNNNEKKRSIKLTE